MTPIRQTVVGGEFGNCLQAATASYFDLELSKVPNFILFGREEHRYWTAFNIFVQSLGHKLFGYVEGLPPEDGQYYMVQVDFGSHVKSGHSVIWKDGAIVHDPQLSKPNQDDNITGYYHIEKIS